MTAKLTLVGGEASQRTAIDRKLVLAQARGALQAQASAVAALGDRLDARFCGALELLLACPGRVVLCGVGKSGLVARKLSALFSSTGTPSFFLHAAEAAHGDLGMVTTRDLVIMISNSGETYELLQLVPYLQRLGVPLIGLLGQPEASLSRLVDVTLDVSVAREACPLELTPTASTLAALAMGNTLVTLLMQLRGLRSEDLARFHPGGMLGHKLSVRVREVMNTRVPSLPPEASMSECLMCMTEGRCGLAVVLDDGGRLRGVVTDGDVRRGLQRDSELLGKPVTSFMTLTPVTIGEDAALATAERKMRQSCIKALIVHNREGRVTGVIERC